MTSSTLGKDSAKAISLIHQLRESGADLDFDLPRVVFAGKQSAGKSSLVEALTGISLPRAHRTCTRCPIEVTTCRSSELESSWKCEISLRVMFDAMDRALASVAVHRLGSLTLQERKDVPRLIREAQEKLLDMDYPQNDDSEKKKLLFTRNVVCVQISGPACEDLAIIDLPGLIQSQEVKENEIYIDRVEGLVKSYMEKENTVIVQCIASDEDIENQRIFSMARDVDPKGLRTIGVLTKPDKVERGTEDDIIAILTGKTYSLVQGFFVVRSPNKEELDKICSSDDNGYSTYEKGREIESSFFQQHETGKRFFQVSPDRCGSEKLLIQLSVMLKNMIDDQVPAMLNVARKLVEKTNTELQDLGPSVSAIDSRAALNDAIREFTAMSGEFIRSSGDRKSLWHKIRLILDDSRQKFDRVIPSFDVGGKLVYCGMSDPNLITEKSDYFNEPIILNIAKQDATEMKRVNSPRQKLGGLSWSLQFRPGLNGTSVCVYAFDLPRGAKSVNAQYKIVPSGFAAAAVREHRDPTCGESSVERLITTHVGNKPLKPTGNVLIEVYIKILGFNAIQQKEVTSNGAKTSNVDKPYTITKVKDMIMHSTRREINLPGPASYTASEEIIKGGVQTWIDPAKSCVDDIHAVMLEEFTGNSPNSAVSLTISEQYPHLRRKICQVVSCHLSKLKDHTMNRILELLEMESALYTSNNVDLAENRRRYQAMIRSLDSTKSMDSKVSSLSPNEQSQLNVILAKLGCKKDDLELIPSGNALNEEVLDVMAGVLAYFGVKCRVFSDSVHQHIIYHLIDKFAKESTNELIRGTNAMSEKCETIHGLFSQSDEVEHKRSILMKSMERQRQCLLLLTEYVRGNVSLDLNILQN